MQCDKPNSVAIFVVSGKFFEKGAGTRKGSFGLACGHKIMIEVGVCLKQEIQSNILL